MGIGAVASALDTENVFLHSSSIVICEPQKVTDGDWFPGWRQDARSLMRSLGPVDEVVSVFVALTHHHSRSGCFTYPRNHHQATDMVFEPGEFSLHRSSVVYH